VRYRIDGMLVDAHSLPKWVQNPLTARIKIMAKADITERRTPQDGSFTIRHASAWSTCAPRSADDRRREVRAPTARSERHAAAARPTRARVTRPRRIARCCGGRRHDPLTVRRQRQVEHAQRDDPGDLLAAAEHRDDRESGRVPARGVTQVEVNEKQGLTFATVLRSVLRQDPDVIMVGEIRDRETAEIAFRAAQTGHLVLSTLHTNDTSSTITRLLDIGIEPYLISSSLVAVIAQRLVRSYCEHCAEPASPESPRLAARLKNSARAAVARAATARATRAAPAATRSRGHKGIQRLIEARAPEGQFRLIAEEEGMVALRQNALAKVEAGVTASEEATRVIQLETRSPQCPQCVIPWRITSSTVLLPLRAAARLRELRQDPEKGLDELSVLQHRGRRGRKRVGGRRAGGIRHAFFCGERRDRAAPKEKHEF